MDNYRRGTPLRPEREPAQEFASDGSRVSGVGSVPEPYPYNGGPPNTPGHHSSPYRQTPAPTHPLPPPAMTAGSDRGNSSGHRPSTGIPGPSIRPPPPAVPQIRFPDPQPYAPYAGYEPATATPFMNDDDFYERSAPAYNGAYHAAPAVPPLPTHMPEPVPPVPYDDPDTYLLNPYPKYNDTRADHDGPDAHANGRTSARHAFNLPLFSRTDSYNDSFDDEESTFRPFPVSGDQYPLNTYESESESFESGSDSYLDDDDDTYSDMPPPLAGAAPPPPPPPGLIPPPEEGQQPRRAKTMKRVRLYKGNLVLDCPVSKNLLSQLPEPRNEREFTHMRYSAATCDPSEFVANHFTLRQTCYQLPRETELFVCVTLYNEDDILLGRTLQGVFKNIKHLSSRNRSKTWGKDAWKKIVICIVADGRLKINPRAKALLAALGVYQDGFAKNIVNDRPVTAHIYEYTTMVGISKVDKTVKLTTEKTVPVQMVFCLKEKNQKKINSHRWFFQAFGPVLRPNVCVLLDAGTQPGHDSIYHLWKTFDTQPHVGGACGEIMAYLGTGWTKLINPLVAAQNFEYKMSNILDKPLESSFGFISVLPGAFSAYRYVALQNDIHGEGPLEKYFKGEKLHDSGAGIFTANMYLAEDRILCFELVAKRHERWILKYVKSAHAQTDVPDRLAELVLQRRRWLNGSFFAAVYAQVHLFQIWRSAHSIGRKLMLHLEFMYQLFTILFSWFSIGNFFLVFRILTSSLGDPGLGFAPGRVLSAVFLWIYGGCMITIFVLSFGNRPLGTHIFYIIIAAFFAVLMAYLIFAAIYISVKSVEFAICTNDGFSVALVFGNQTFRDLVVSIMSTYALYVVSSLLFFEPWHLLTCFLQYLLISPAYVNVLNVYAFCNIHDISWGTKGDTGVKTDLGVAKTNEAGKLEVDIPTHVEHIDRSYLDQITALAVPLPKEVTKPSKDDEQQDYYALFRSSVVLAWVFTNVVLIVVVLNTTGLSALTPDGTSTSGSGTGAQALNSLLNSASTIIKRASAEQCGDIGTGEGVRTQIYLSVVLWSVAGLAAFRFIGSLWYLFTRMLGR